MLHNKKTDFLFYLLINVISTLSVLLISLIHNRLNSLPLLDIESFKLAAICFFIHLMITGFLVFQIIIEKFFFFEAFTYLSIFAGIVLLLTTLSNLRTDVIPSVFGFIFLSIGIYLRFCLWHYDAKTD